VVYLTTSGIRKLKNIRPQFNDDSIGHQIEIANTADKKEKEQFVKMELLGKYMLAYISIPASDRALVSDGYMNVILNISDPKKMNRESQALNQAILQPSASYAVKDECSAKKKAVDKRRRELEALYKLFVSFGSDWDRFNEYRRPICN